MKKNTYTLSTARAKLTEIINKVLDGEEIILTKVNIPVVKIVKVDEED